MFFLHNSTQLGQTASKHLWGGRQRRLPLLRSANRRGLRVEEVALARPQGRGGLDGGGLRHRGLHGEEGGLDDSSEPAASPGHLDRGPGDVGLNLNLLILLVYALELWRFLALK